MVAADRSGHVAPGASRGRGGWGVARVSAALGGHDLDRRRPTWRSRPGAAARPGQGPRRLRARAARGRCDRSAGRGRALGLPMRRARHGPNRRLGAGGRTGVGRSVRPGRGARGVAAGPRRAAVDVGAAPGAHGPVGGEHPGERRRAPGGGHRLRRRRRRGSGGGPAVWLEPVRGAGAGRAPRSRRRRRGHVAAGAGLRLRRAGPFHSARLPGIDAGARCASPGWSGRSRPRSAWISVGAPAVGGSVVRGGSGRWLFACRRAVGRPSSAP